MPLAHDHYVNQILTQGYAIIPDVLDSDQLVIARAALQRIFEAESEIGKAKQWHTNTHIAAYLLPQKDPFFRTVGLNPRLLPIIQQILGKNCNLSNVNGMTMTPGGEPQQLHQDTMESTPGMCVYINALHCLDDFTQANGGTRLVPRSHNKLWPPGSITPEQEKFAVYLEAKAGSVIAFDGALLHAGSRNTTDKPRRALHLYYHRPWARPQWDYPRSFSADLIAQLTEEEKRLYGFYSAPVVYSVPHHDSTKSK